MQDKKIDILKFNMDRIDNYIEKADNKASFILAFNGVIIGIIFSNIKSIIQFISLNDFSVGIFLFLISVFGCFILSILHSLSVLHPRKSKNIDTYKSILYYKDISSMSSDDYKGILKQITKDEDLLEELCKQIREISIICNKKMEHMRKSMIFLIVGSLISIVFMILYAIQSIFVC